MSVWDESDPERFVDDEGYEIDDPKHSDYYDTFSELWDNRDKTQEPA